MEHLAEFTIRRAASEAQPPTLQVLPAGSRHARLADFENPGEGEFLQLGRNTLAGNPGRRHALGDRFVR